MKKTKIILGLLVLIMITLTALHVNTQQPSTIATVATVDAEPKTSPNYEKAALYLTRGLIDPVNTCHMAEVKSQHIIECVDLVESYTNGGGDRAELAGLLEIVNGF